MEFIARSVRITEGVSEDNINPRHMAEISIGCALLYHLLVQAALFPKLGLEVPEFVSSLEEDEHYDALTHGGVIWDDLLHIWAFESGTAKLEEIVGGRGATVDATGYHAAIGELQQLVDIEFNVPLHPMGAEGPLAWTEVPFEEMPTFEGQRLHLYRRSTWFEIDFSGDFNGTDHEDEDAIEAATPSGEIPLFAEPVHSSTSSGRLGRVWVRVGEESRTQLKIKLADTLELLCIIGHARADALQDALHSQQPALGRAQLKDLNSYVQMLRTRARVHGESSRRLREIADSDDRARVAATFLELINTNSPGETPTADRSSRPTVFLSYSHDSDAHRAWVLTLSEELIASGFDARLDRAQESPEEGWPRWMCRQAEWTDFVLCVCTPLYKQRFDSRQALGTGQGADWEGFLITQLLYESGGRNQRIVPVLPDSGSSHDIPLPLRAFTYYKLPSDKQQLMGRLSAGGESGPPTVP